MPGPKAAAAPAATSAPAAERDIKAAFDTAPVTIEAQPVSSTEAEPAAAEPQSEPAPRSSKGGGHRSGYRHHSRAPQRKPNQQGCKPFFVAPKGNTPR